MHGINDGKKHEIISQEVNSNMHTLLGDITPIAGLPMYFKLEVFSLAS